MRAAAVILGIVALSVNGLVLSSPSDKSTSSGSTPAVSSPDSMIELDATTGRVLRTVSATNRGDRLAGGPTAIWATSYGSGTLARVDPGTVAVAATYGVNGAPPVGVAAGPDAIWVTTAFGDDSLRKFDPRTGHWAAPIRLASGLEGIAYSAKGLWVANKAENLVYRVDPSSDAVTARIAVGEGPEAIALSPDAVWVANAVGDSVSRIDPASNSVIATIALRGSPSAIAVGSDAVWVVSEAASSLIRIDPVTNTATQIPFGVGPSGIAVAGAAVWVTEGVSGRISRVDPATLRATLTIEGQGAVADIAADGGSIWVTRHQLRAPTPPIASVPRGGTLRVVVPAWKPSEFANPEPKLDALDPQVGGNTLDSNEILRCCLVRTLVSHVGRSYRDGGAELRPDLALKLPEVSADGLAWTFVIRPGMRYAPPMERTEITAADFVRALQRDARVAHSTTFSVIEGYDAYADGNGNPSTIKGLETVDRFTLRVHLAQVAGDLPDRFALPETGPLPPSPPDVNAPFGVATGHDAGFGRFLVSSGPYMIEGSSRLDPALPGEKQAPLSGFEPGRSLSLVRNPSWTAQTDPLRPAYVDAIRVTIGMSDDDAATLMDSGAADLILRGSPPPQAMPWLTSKVQSDPRLGHVETNQRDFLRWVEMNVAVPPFDDIHVRRAVNYVLDKTALVEAHGGQQTGKVFTHYSPDSLEGDALSGYDPYATPGARGSLTLARQEISQSKYDPGHTGMCTAPACKHILAATIPTGTGLFPRLYGGFPRLGEMIASDLGEIGITLNVQSTQATSEMMGDPQARLPLALTQAGGSAEVWMNTSASFPSDFGEQGLDGSLVGATSEQLRAWGYTATHVPNIDNRIEECMHGGVRQLQCWNALDVYMMEKVVPVAPYMTENVIDVVPSRVVNYSFDQSSDEVALDQIAVAPTP